MSDLAIPDAVLKVEEALENMPQVDLGTQMLLHAGVCARSIFIPAGTALVGVLTSVDNVNVVYGDISVTTSDGPKRLTGFNVIPANSGFKRVGFAHSDTWWVTIHKTDKTELEDIEAEMTCEPEKLQTRRQLAIEQGKETVCLGQQ